MYTDRAKKRIPEIMRHFPSQTVQIKRPAYDAYGSETGTSTALGSVDIWLEGVNRPSRYDLSDRAQLPVDTDMRWAAILRENSTPAVMHGDMVVFGDGSTRRIRAIIPDGVSAREFWLLSEG